MVVTMNEPNYRIKYRQGDFEIEVQGDKEWVEQKFEELTERKSVRGAEVAEAKEIDLPSSLVEFIKQKGDPSRHIDLITIFGYWLFHKLDTPTFNKKDIQSCYADARISESSNTSAEINHAQAEGYFRRAEERKDGLIAWTITPTGEKYVKQMK